MNRHTLAPQVRRDLNEIWTYIATDSPDAAEAWLDKLQAAFKLLGSNPGLGHTRLELAPASTLFWAVGAYLILYRITSRGVQITAVTHGARDIPALLRGRKG